MRIIYLLLLLFIGAHDGIAQEQTKQDFSTSFAFQVKSVDDFFDRFNFGKKSSFRNYLVKKYPTQKLNRKDLIVSLFNLSNPEFDRDEIKRFIREVTDSIHPKYLSYSDTEWYSELTCKVQHKGKLARLILILKVVRSDNGGYSWDIVSANADFLKFKPVRSDSLLMQRMEKNAYEKDNSYFLSPVSHGFDFSNMDNFFLNKSKVNNYIYPGPKSFELNKLIHKIQKSEITFIQVDKIRYHLLQIEGWMLILDYFSRENLNSGWLIQQMVSATQQDKNEHKKNTLRIQLQ